MLERMRLLLAVWFIFGVGTAWCADNQVMSELRFEAKTDATRNAGVWLDGQYVGYVMELKDDKKILLLPGKHDILVRQTWYRDYVEHAVLEPGELHVVKVSLTRAPAALSAIATAELKISAKPNRAAVFVDDQFAGHVSEFDGLGKAMLLTPGPHRVRIALPGYQPFEASVNLRPRQKMKLQTDLAKGSIVESGSLVTKK